MDKDNQNSDNQSSSDSSSNAPSPYRDTNTTVERTESQQGTINK